MPTLEEAKIYLRIDHDTEDTLILSLLDAADGYLQGAVGKDYPKEDARAKTLALLVVSDLYEQRSLNGSTKVSANTRRLVDDLSLQLRMELRNYAE